MDSLRRLVAVGAKRKTEMHGAHLVMRSATTITNIIIYINVVVVCIIFHDFCCIAYCGISAYCNLISLMVELCVDDVAMLVVMMRANNLQYTFGGGGVGGISTTATTRRCVEPARDGQK